MVLDAETVDASIAETVKNELTRAGFAPENVSLGKKDDFPALLVQIAMNDDKQVQGVVETLQKTLTEK